MDNILMNNRYSRQYAGFRVQMADADAELELYGEIVETQPKNYWNGKPIEGNWIIQNDVLNELKTLKNAGAKKLRLRINSLGGDAGVAITVHNRILEMSRGGMEIRCVIDGVAASGGSLIACACDEVEVFASSLFMVHKCWGFMFGGYNADELRAEARQRDAWDQAQINIYHRKSGLSDTVISHMMSDTTYLTGEDIINKGFADKLAEGGGAKVAASADGSCLLVNGVRMHLAPGMAVPEGIPRAESGDRSAEMEVAQRATGNGGAVGGAPSADGDIITPAAAMELSACAANGGAIKLDCGCLTQEERERVLEIFRNSIMEMRPAEENGAPGGGFLVVQDQQTEDGNGAEIFNSELRTPNSELETVSTGEDPEDINHEMPAETGEEGGNETMARNLEELRAENPELAAQVEADVRAGLTADTNAAVEAERSRIREIDEIAGLYPTATVTEAKYGAPCTAQEMAFRAAQQAAKTGSTLMTAVMADANGEGGANAVKAADAQPDNTVAKTDEEKQAEADKAVHALFHKNEEV